MGKFSLRTVMPLGPPDAPYNWSPFWRVEEFLGLGRVTMCLGLLEGRSVLLFHQHLKDCDMGAHQIDGLHRTPGELSQKERYILWDKFSDSRIYCEIESQRRYILILLKTPWLCCDTC